MGILNSSQERNTQCKVNVGTANGFFLESIRSCSNSFVDDTPSPTISLANNRATGEVDDNSLNKEYDANGQELPNYCSISKLKYLSCVKGGCKNHMNLVPSESYQNIRNSRIARNSWSTLSCVSFTTNSQGTYEAYESTPLTEVLPSLYLGSREDADQKEKITSLGITHIISVSGGGRHKDLCAKYMYLPLRDNGSSDLLGKLKNSWNFMVESQEPNSKLFIHCELGQNRSPSLVIGFLMRYKNWCLHEAYRFLKEKRELIHPHKKYIQQLRSLDKELHGVFSTPASFLDLELCCQEGIKIRHHDFSTIASHAYIRRQKTSRIEKKALLTNSLRPGQDSGSSYTICLSNISKPSEYINELQD